MSAEAQREDLPRISCETLDDWRRIKRNYTIAALTALDEQLSGNNSPADREALLAHLHKVCCFCLKREDVTKCAGCISSLTRRLR